MLPPVRQISALTSPLPECLGFKQHVYGDFVRFASLDFRLGVHASTILSNCRNLSHLFLFVNSPRSGWSTIISQIQSLVALRIITYTTLSVNGQSLELTFPNLELLGLEIRKFYPWGTERWNLPKLKRLAILCDGDHTRIQEFLSCHGRNLETLKLSFAHGCTGIPFYRVLLPSQVESLCPRLTHLKIPHLMHLLYFKHETIHRGITILTLPHIQWNESMAWASMDNLRSALENLHRVLFPSLKQIYCPWDSPSSAAHPRPSELPSKIRPWFVELLAEWDRTDIKFLWIETNEGMPL